MGVLGWWRPMLHLVLPKRKTEATIRDWGGRREVIDKNRIICGNRGISKIGRKRNLSTIEIGEATCRNSKEEKRASGRRAGIHVMCGWANKTGWVQGQTSKWAGLEGQRGVILRAGNSLAVFKWLFLKYLSSSYVFEVAKRSWFSLLKLHAYVSI